MSSCDNNSGSGATPNTGSSPTQPTNGTSQPCQHCTITSQTFASIPADRARTRIGVGEEVTLTVTPGPAQWSVQGCASLNPTSGSVVNFRAGHVPGPITVTARASGCTCTITFTVVEPEALFMNQYPGSAVRHKHNQPSSGFLGLPCLYPYDVNFYNVEVRELNSAATTSGYYATWSGVTHQGAGVVCSPWLNVLESSQGIISAVDGWDKIWSGYLGTPPSAGQMVWPITWEFRVWGSAPKALRRFHQTHTVDAAGTCVTSKGGTTVSAAYGEPDSPPDNRWN